MPVVTAYATAVPANPGGWANTANMLGVNDGTVGTVSPARNVMAYVELQLDPTKLGANIPAGAVLVGTPSRSLWIGSSSNAQVSATRQWFVNDVAITTEDPATVTIGVTEEVAPAPLTIAHLQGNKVVLRIGVTRTGTQARTFSLDALRLTFEYVLYLIPVASFTVNKATIYTDQQVQFTDTSTNAPDQWSWDFDGGAAASTQQNPLVTFSTPGVYNVVLTASNPGGSDASDPVTVTVLAREAEVFNGSAWVGGQSWNGSAWVRPEVWDGVRWVPMKAP